MSLVWLCADLGLAQRYGVEEETLPHESLLGDTPRVKNIPNGGVKIASIAPKSVAEELSKVPLARWSVKALLPAHQETFGLGEW